MESWLMYLTSCANRERRNCFEVFFLWYTGVLIGIKLRTNKWYFCLLNWQQMIVHTSALQKERQKKKQPEKSKLSSSGQVEPGKVIPGPHPPLKKCTVTERKCVLAKTCVLMLFQAHFYPSRGTLNTEIPIVWFFLTLASLIVSLCQWRKVYSSTGPHTSFPAVSTQQKGDLWASGKCCPSGEPLTQL